jgi:hypothetical protein
VGKNDENNDAAPPFQPPLPGGKKGMAAQYGAHGVLSAVIFWAGTELHSLNAKMDGLATKVAAIEARMSAIDKADLDGRVRALEAMLAELRARFAATKEK